MVSTFQKPTQYEQRSCRQMVEQRINSEVKIKVLIEPMNNPLGVSPSKGNQGTARGKEKIFWPILSLADS